MTFVNWALVVLTAATFAVSLPFNKFLVNEFSPITLSAARAVLALPFIWPVAVAFGAGFPRALGDWRAAFIGAVLLVAIPFSAIAFGQQHIPSGLGGILYGSMPLITAVIASALVPGERLSGLKIVGCLVGLAGVTIIIGPAALEGVGSHLLGVLVTLVAPLSYAAGTVVLRLLPASNPLVLTSGMFVAAAALMVPLTAGLDGEPEVAAVQTMIWPLVGLATLGTAVPAFLNYVLIRRAGAVNASLVMFIMPIFAVAFGAIIFGERIQIEALIGMCLTVIGCIVVSNRPALPFRPKSTAK